jgi:hypothetical protein
VKRTLNFNKDQGKEKAMYLLSLFQEYLCFSVIANYEFQVKFTFSQILLLTNVIVGVC